MKRSRKNMSLTTVSLLISLGLFLVLGAAMILLVGYHLRQQSLSEAESRARLVLNRNLAIHTYFSQELKPAVFSLTEQVLGPSDFDPTWMSSTYAFRRIHAHLKLLTDARTGHMYKECAVNARSPFNEADEQERAFLRALNGDPGLQEKVSVRTFNGKPFLVLMKRGEVMEASCLRCHGDAEDAPDGLVDRYGPKRSFHRQVGEVASALSIRVPLSFAYSPVNRFTLSLAGALLALFAALFTVQHALDRRFLIEPLEKIRRKAVEIAQKAGEGNSGEIPSPFGRELQELTSEFNNLIRNLDAAQAEQEERIHERTADLVQANERLRKEIQERLRVEKQLRESEERFRLLTEQSPDAVIMIDGEGRVLFANPATESFFNIQKNRLEGSHFGFPMVSEEATEIEVPRVNGETATAEMRVVKTHLNQEPVYIASLRDMTERKAAEASLSRLAAAIEHAAESVHVTDPDGNIQFVNPAFERITGYSSGEAAGMWAGLLRPKERSKEPYRTMWRQVLDGETWSGHLQGVARDGARFEVAASISPVKDAEGETTNAVVVMRDVSQEVALERQLRQAQKMEAIGTLAGGIAHDFNNILSAILGYAELTQRNLPQESEDRENIREVILAARRARDLIKQILAFSRQSEEEFQPVELHLIVKEAFKLLRSSLPSSIEMRQAIQRCRPVIGDPIQLHQVVMNLCTNASQAMSEEEGSLFLGLEEVELTADQAAEIALEAAGAYVKLTVQDTGHGISPTILDRIFEPYFTTKEKGKGTGLGLSVVHGIAKAHGGCVAVRSHPGKGTAFFVFFPVTDLEAWETATEEVNVPGQGGNERILLVDDERALVNMIHQVLENLGYRVEAFTDSQEALEHFQAHPDRFDLILTDLTMPGLTGDRLAQEVLALRPSAPVILCTGFSERIDGERARALGIRAFMLKPLMSRALSETVRRVLDGEKDTL